MTNHIQRLDDILERHRSSTTPAPCFVGDDGSPVSIEAFDRLVAQTCAWLANHGLVRGDCIGLWFANRIEWPVLLFASARLGIRVAAVNTRYRSAELEYMLSKARARMLFFDPNSERGDEIPVLNQIDPSRLPSLEAQVHLSRAHASRLDATPWPSIDFDAFDTSPPEPPISPDRESDPDDSLIYFTTSGTTSAPKLVVHPQRTVARHALNCAASYGFAQPQSRFLAVMPLCGVFGFSAAIAAVAGGAPVHLLTMFEPQAAVERIRAQHITHLIGSDEMFRRLLDTDPRALDHTRVCGFAAFTPGLLPLLERHARAGVALYGVYGSSEVNALFAMQPAGLPVEERLKAGGAPASGEQARVRVRDSESGRLLAIGETGELEISAPTSFSHYLDDDEATRIAIDDEGYFRTGDIGYLRDDGTFVYLARTGDAIRLSGFLVDPAEIEAELKQIGGFADIQVVGVMHEGRMRPVAFAIPEPGYASVDEQRLIETARQRLAHFKVPLRAYTIDAFPMIQGANGEKVQKAKLRELATERLAAQATPG